MDFQRGIMTSQGDAVPGCGSCAQPVRLLGGGSIGQRHAVMLDRIPVGGCVRLPACPCVVRSTKPAAVLVLP